MRNFKSVLIFGILATSLSACNLAALFDEPTEGQLAARALTAAAAGGSFGPNGSEAVSIYNQVRGQSTSSASQIPDNLKATYTGSLGIGDVTNGVIGDITLNVSIVPETSSIQGRATNFVDALSRPATGIVTLGESQIDQNANPNDAWQFNMYAQGSIAQQNGQTRTINGSLVGEFVGGGGNLISGELLDPSNSGFFAASR